MPELKFHTIKKYIVLLTDDKWLKPPKDKRTAIKEKVQKLQEESALVQSNIKELEEKKLSLVKELETKIAEIEQDLVATREAYGQSKTEENKNQIILLDNAISEVRKPILDIDRDLKNLAKELEKKQKSIELLEKELTKSEPDTIATKDTGQESSGASSSSSKTSDTELKITKKTKLTRDEAFLLLQNIQLLRADKIPGFKMECADELRNLLFAEFLEICDSDDIGAKILQDSFLRLQAIPDYCDKEIGSISIAIRSIGINLCNNYIKKLHVWFDNSREKMLSYLSAANYSSSEAFERSFSFELPDTDKLLVKELEFWRKVNSNLGRVGVALFANANGFSCVTKFQEIILQYGPLDRWSSDQQRAIKAELEIIESGLVYETAKNPELARLFDLHNISGSLFKKALEFIKNNAIKKTDLLPDIRFEFKVGQREYKFQKLPAGDYRGFILGKLTNCCQSLGDDSSRCVEDGMTKNSAGFYVITDEKGKILAQSYAWLGEGNKLVLDSFEYLGNNPELFIPAIGKFSQILATLSTPISLMIGTGGRTPKIKVSETQKRPEPVDKSLFMYGDSRLVYVINESEELRLESEVVQSRIIDPDVRYFNYWFKFGYANVIFNVELFCQYKFKEVLMYIAILGEMLNTSDLRYRDFDRDVTKVLSPLNPKQTEEVIVNLLNYRGVSNKVSKIFWIYVNPLPKMCGVIMWIDVDRINPILEKVTIDTARKLMQTGSKILPSQLITKAEEVIRPSAFISLSKPQSRVLFPDIDTKKLKIGQIISTKKLFDLVMGAQTIDLDNIQNTIVKGPAILSATNKDGKTIIHVATEMSCQEVAPINVDKLAKAILDSVRLRGSESEVKNIINLKDNLGNTPLHYAAAFNNEELIEYLKQNGADCNIKNKHGKTYLGIKGESRDNPGRSVVPLGHRQQKSTGCCL